APFDIQALLGKEVVVTTTLVEGFVDVFLVAERGDRFDVDPAVIAIVDAKAGDAATRGEDGLEGWAAEDRVDRRDLQGGRASGDAGPDLILEPFTHAKGQPNGGLLGLLHGLRAQRRRDEKARDDE